MAHFALLNNLCDKEMTIPLQGQGHGRYLKTLSI